MGLVGPTSLDGHTSGPCSDALEYYTSREDDLNSFELGEGISDMKAAKAGFARWPPSPVEPTFPTVISAMISVFAVSNEPHAPWRS